MENGHRFIESATLSAKLLGISAEGKSPLIEFLGGENTSNRFLMRHRTSGKVVIGAKEAVRNITIKVSFKKMAGGSDVMHNV